MTGYRPPQPIQPRFDASGVHIITGGLGAIGLELARWLLERNASRVVLTTRSGIKSGWQRFRFNALIRDYPNRAVISKLDVIEREQVDQLLDPMTHDRQPVHGVWHTAVVFADKMLHQLTHNNFDQVYGSKVIGLRNLDAAIRDPSVLLVAFSSVSGGLVGVPGQTAYGLSNSECDRIIERRCARGLRGISIQWGAIDGVGYFASNDAAKHAVRNMEGKGAMLQNVDDSLDALDSLLSRRCHGTVSAFRKKTIPVPNDKRASKKELTLFDVRAKVAEVLGGEVDAYNSDVSLGEVGLDSLSTIELSSWVNANSATNIAPDLIGPGTTISMLYHHVHLSSSSAM